MIFRYLCEGLILIHPVFLIESLCSHQVIVMAHGPKFNRIQWVQISINGIVTQKSIKGYLQGLVSRRVLQITTQILF